jgi:riboflavin transporter FmnP
MDIKDSIIVLCTLFFGVPSGLIVSVIVPLLEYITVSGTGEYGLIMNIISSASLCIPVGIIYRYRKTLKGAILGLCVSVVSMTAVMMVANLFITPFYMGVSRAEVASLIPSMLLPFNLVKGILNAAIVLLLYKPLSRALKKNRLIETTVSKNTEPHVNNNRRSIIVTISSIAVIVISLVVIFVILGGRISFLDGIINK